MKIDLHYGDGFVAVEIPQANIGKIIRPWTDDSAQDNDTVVHKALTTAQAADFQRVIEGKRVCVLVGDGSRDMPLADILGQLLCLLTRSLHIRFLICTGTHNSHTPENDAICKTIKGFAEKCSIPDFEICVHDCTAPDLLNAGTTSRGTQVLYNPGLLDADAFVVLSDVKFHYFAGYSNPIKNFLPGLCSFLTAEKNHSYALDERSTYGVHPWQSDPNRRNNPLAADQLEGMEMITQGREVFAFVTISTSGKIQRAWFGKAQTVTTEAFKESDQRNTHTVEPTDRMIVSPGGLPNDVDLYISQRALELTKNAVSDGGEVLFVSACPAGIGHDRTMENFYNRLVLPVDEILDSIGGQYKLFSHKPYKFAQMIRRLDKIWVYSQIKDDLVSAAHLYPTHDIQKIVDRWIDSDPAAKITIVDGANKIALYARQNG